jgi:hypothetical protein
MSWAAHDLEPYVIQRHFGRNVAFVPLLIGSYAPGRWVAWLIWARVVHDYPFDLSWSGPDWVESGSLSREPREGCHHGRYELRLEVKVDQVVAGNEVVVSDGSVLSSCLTSIARPVRRSRGHTRMRTASS